MKSALVVSHVSIGCISNILETRSMIVKQLCYTQMHLHICVHVRTHARTHTHTHTHTHTGIMLGPVVLSRRGPVGKKWVESGGLLSYLVYSQCYLTWKTQWMLGCFTSWLSACFKKAEPATNNGYSWTEQLLFVNMYKCFQDIFFILPNFMILCGHFCWNVYIITISHVLLMLILFFFKPSVPEIQYDKLIFEPCILIQLLNNFSCVYWISQNYIGFVC
jgi:hypothetical protein